LEIGFRIANMPDNIPYGDDIELIVG
jgi:hypothetical protein